jgi:hypothetical protein
MIDTVSCKTNQIVLQCSQHVKQRTEHVSFGNPVVDSSEVLMYN